MAITVECDCGHSFAVEAKHSGKLIRCKACGEAVRVPESKVSQKKPTRVPGPQRESRPARPERPERPAARPAPERSERRSPQRDRNRGRGGQSGSNMMPMLIGGGAIFLLLAVLGIGYVVSKGLGGDETPTTASTDIIVPENPVPSPGAQARAAAGDTPAPGEPSVSTTGSSDPSRTGFIQPPSAPAGGATGFGYEPGSGRPSVTARQPMAPGGGTLRAAVETTADVAFVGQTGLSSFARINEIWYGYVDKISVSRTGGSSSPSAGRGLAGGGSSSSSSQGTGGPVIQRTGEKVVVQLNLVSAETDGVKLHSPQFGTTYWLRQSSLRQITYINPTLSKTTSSRTKSVRWETKGVMSKWNETSGYRWASGSQPQFARLPKAWPIIPTEDPPNDLKELIPLVERSVVRIDVVTPQGEGNGSGYLIDSSGLIATNYHVIEGGFNVSVNFRTGEKMPAVGYVYKDPKRDLAIIRTMMPPGHFPGLKLAGSVPQKGEKVLAFGAPLGLDYTASDGIISGVRTSADLKTQLNTDRDGVWLQTTAPISPGNSGGPLVTHAAEVVGLNTMTLTVGQNLNFAIASDSIEAALTQLAESPVPITPKTVPHMITEKPEGGTSIGGGVTIADLEGKPEADQYLAELDELMVEAVVNVRSISLIQVKRPLQGLLQKTAGEYLSKGGVEPVIDEGPIMIIEGEIQGQDRLIIAVSVYTARPNKNRGVTIRRVWRKNMTIGTMTNKMLERDRFTGEPRRNMEKFFTEFTKAVADAKQNVAAEKP